MKNRMNVRVGFLFLLMLVLMLAMAACGGSDETSNSNTDASTNAQNEDSANEDAAGKETYELTLNSAYPPPEFDDEPKALAVDRLAELVNERTDGRVNIDVFYSNQLVDVDQALDALQSGTIDIEAAGPYWGDQIQTQDFPWLPFGFYGPEYMHHLMRDTEIGDIFEKNLEEEGVKVLMYWPAGVEGIISKDPITKLEDMEGKTARLGSGLWTEWYKEMGASAANVAGAELYEALMRGTIDIAMYPFYTVDTNSLHEVADHITVPGIADPILVFDYISLDTWNELPDDIQQTIEEVVAELEEEAVEASQRMTENALQYAEDHGVTVHHLSEEEYEKFVESSQVAWDEFENRNEDTKRMVEILREDQEDYLQNNPEAEEWVKQWLK